MGANTFKKKDLMNLSRNVLFDKGSFEDLKKFSNTLLEPNKSAQGYNSTNKYKSMDYRRRLQQLFSLEDKKVKQPLLDSPRRSYQGNEAVSFD